MTIAAARGIHHFPTGPFNWYVIEEASRLTLVDAGFPGHYRVFQEGLRAIGRTMKDVDAVVLTHAHADHTGFAERVRREAGARVFVHGGDLAMAKSVLQLPWFGLLSNAWRPFTASMLARAALNGVFTMPSLSTAEAMKDGEILDVPGRPHVVHVPGHTPGEVALFLPERGVLLSGDTMVTLDLFSGRAGGPQLPHRLLNGDDLAARRSLDRLRELGRVTMLPGHGPAWTGLAAEAIELARRDASGHAAP